MKDIFISHCWGNDTLARDNHKRCKIIADKLIHKGYSVWFDSYDLFGNIDSNIMKGINNCKVVIVCLTKNYCDKINNAAINQLPNDNCYKEWNYSLFKQKIIIPILLEPCMHSIFLKNDGIIQMYLNSIMYIDFTENFNDDMYILCKSLKNNAIYNFDEKKFYSNVSNSFANFILSLTGMTVSSISPRSIKILTKKFNKEQKNVNKREKQNVLKRNRPQILQNKKWTSFKNTVNTVITI